MGAKKSRSLSVAETYEIDVEQDARLDALEARVAQLEGRPTVLF